MNPETDIAETLQGNLRLYDEVLEVVRQERDRLAGPEPTPGDSALQRLGKDLLARLARSMEYLAGARAAWEALDAACRARHREIGDLVRRSQAQLMKILVLDRENEQAMLRLGWVPVRDLPSVNRQRPHFVAQMYRRSGR